MRTTDATELDGLAEALVDTGRRAGLDAVGIAPAEPFAGTRSILEARKAKDLHGGMHFTFGDPQYHYRSYSLQLQMPNGVSEELQIVPRPVFEANRQEHHAYKRARNAELAGRGAGSATAAARVLNDRAMERYVSKNGAHPSVVKGAVVKGSRVMLADGAPARVLYVDPNMRIARVRTETAAAQ